MFELSPYGWRANWYAMISVIIPTLNAEERFAACLTALVPAAVEGLVREVIVVDAGSTDHTLKIADQAGVDVVSSEAGRGVQLRAGARRARQPWLLFLHADTVLAPGWDIEAAEFMERVENGRHRPMAATFSFALDDYGAAPRMLEWLVAMRGLLLGLPYGDQGLLIPRQLYDEVGGFQAMPLMEDVAIVRRIGRRRIWRLRSGAVTGSSRYRAEGYFRRVMRNQLCLALYAVGVPPARIASFYANSAPSAQDANAPKVTTDAAPPERRRRVNSA